MYRRIDQYKSEMDIVVDGVTIQMTRQFAIDLNSAIYKSLSLETKQLANHSFSDKQKQTLIQLMDRLSKVEKVEIYTTTEKEALPERAKAHFC